MIGRVLRDKRKAAGLTQEKLAFEAGVHRTYVSMLEREEKNPTVDVLFRICDALDVKASEVIAEVERRRESDQHN